MMPRYEVGQKVRVLELNKSGHIRTPHYVRHKVGTVIQYCGSFLNPEELARGNTAGPVVENYRVAFKQKDLWPKYEGPDSDSLVLEIYHHWLAPEA